jgi:serine protease AprX
LFVPNYPYHDEAYTLLPMASRLNLANPAYNGQGVVVAFIDSGFYPHPELQGRILTHVDASTDLIIEARVFKSAGDLGWHGQMTSVIACGDGKLSDARKYKGLAHAAKVVLIKVSTPQGRIKERDILRGLRWLVKNHARFGVRVLNISVGGDFESQDPDHDLHKAIRDLANAGVVTTIAAGNAGQKSLVPPASAPEAITVGGYDDHNLATPADWRPYNNNYGQAYDGTAKPEMISAAAWLPSPIMPGSLMAREARWLAPILHAPNESTVRQLLLSGYSDLGILRGHAFRPDAEVFAQLQKRIHKHKLIDSRRQHVDGTSVSSAVAASVIALMLEANPALKPNEIKAILQETATPLPDVATERQGAGAIEAAAAIAAAVQEATPSATLHKSKPTEAN